MLLTFNFHARIKCLSRYENQQHRWVKRTKKGAWKGVRNNNIHFFVGFFLCISCAGFSPGRKFQWSKSSSPFWRSAFLIPIAYGVLLQIMLGSIDSHSHLCTPYTDRTTGAGAVQPQQCLLLILFNEPPFSAVYFLRVSRFAFIIRIACVRLYATIAKRHNRIHNVGPQ